MKQKFSLALAAVAFAACAEPPSTPSATPMERVDEAPLLAKSGGDAPIDGQYIVVFKDDVSDPHGKARSKAARGNGKLKHSMVRR